MDAKRTPCWILICALLVPCGCTLTNTTPSDRPPQPTATEPQEPPQVVADEPQPETTAPESEVNQLVLDYIARPKRRAQDPPPFRHAVDTEPVTTQPASQPSIELIPDPPVETQPTSQPTPGEPASTRPAITTPPKLGPVSIRTEPTPNPVPLEPLAASPGINAPTFAHNAPASLDELLQRLPDPADGSFQEQIKHRLMWAIAGDFDRSRQPLNLVTAEQQDLATGFINAWIQIQEAHMGDLTGAANAATNEVARLQLALEQLSDLTIPTVKICSAVHGYGQYQEIDPPRFAAGLPSEFVLYSEVEHFTSDLRDDGLYYTAFDMTTTILNDAGDTIDEFLDRDIIDRCHNRRRDCFIPRLIRLPATLSPGQYVAKISIVDTLGQKVAENRATFELGARP